MAGPTSWGKATISGLASLGAVVVVIMAPYLILMVGLGAIIYGVIKAEEASRASKKHPPD